MKEILTTDKHLDPSTGSRHRKLSARMPKDDVLSLPKEWEWKKLGEIGKVSMCKRIRKEQTMSAGDIPFYKIGTFGKTPDAFISKKIYQDYKSKYPYPKKGDILLSASGTIGRRVTFDGEPAYFQDSNIVWIDNDEKIVLNEYLYKFYGYCDWNPSKGATISRLYNDDLRKIQIPLPPLAEQKRIVAILDKAFSAINKAKANAEKNLANAKELWESYLNGIFSTTDEHGLTRIKEGWAEKKLGEVCEIKPPKGEARAKINSIDDVSFLPMEDLGICSKNINLKQIKKLSEVEGSYTYFADNDVLLAKITPCFENGKLGIAKNLTNGIGFGSSEYIVFRPCPSIFNEYLFYFLSQESFRYEGAARMTGAVGHKRVAKDFIESYKIPLPPLAEQKRVVAKLDALKQETNRLEEMYRRKIQSLDELKKSILKKAFRGELGKEKGEV